MHAILNRDSRVVRIAAAIFLPVVFANAAPADIFQWEYINPADPSQGKQQSTTLAPGGAGVDAVPGAYLDSFNLTMAYLNGADLHHATLRGTILQNSSMIGANLLGADFSSSSTCCGGPLYLTDLTAADLSHVNATDTNFYAATLTGANLGNANLADAAFWEATLTGADFAGAEVRGANFYTRKHPAVNYPFDSGTGITPIQLYSTASYRDHDLSGIGFHGNELTSANLAEQNLTGADFSEATLTDANFTGTQIQGAGFSRSFYILPGIYEFFAGTGITPAQLYSTASYQARDLRGINLELNDLAGANLAGQNLTNANFGAAALTNSNFRGANLTNADFAAFDCRRFGCGYSPYADLTGTDLTAADTRGAYGLVLPIATTANLIRSDGHIAGVDLVSGGVLVVSDHDGYSRSEVVLKPEGVTDSILINIDPIPITVDQHFTMGPGGTLRMSFEADEWDSTISFAPGIPVTLGGTLDLTFAADVNLASQVGRTLDLFDWTGVSPTGAFGVSSSYSWNLSNLYTTGEVTLTAIPEPTSFALAAAGAFSPTFYRRRKIA